MSCPHILPSMCYPELVSQVGTLTRGSLLVVAPTTSHNAPGSTKSLVFLITKKQKRFPSMAGAGGGGGSTTLCQAENPTVRIFISLLPTQVLHCR